MSLSLPLFLSLCLPIELIAQTRQSSLRTTWLSWSCCGVAAHSSLFLSLIFFHLLPFSHVAALPPQFEGDTLCWSENCSPCVPGFRGPFSSGRKCRLTSIISCLILISRSRGGEGFLGFLFGFALSSVNLA